MFSPLRNRFGIPGAISVIALVFAMFGGAYAASDSSGGGQVTASAGSDSRANKRGQRNKRGKQGGLNAKQKRQVIALAKRFARQGPMGPQGVPGLPGPPGADGDDGDDGSDGSDGADGSEGADGSTVLSGFGAPNNTIGVDGDFYIDTNATTIYGPKAGGSWPTPGTPLEGADGEPWAPDNQLPSGATLTGTYSSQDVDATFGPGLVPVGERRAVSIGFPIPLETAPTAVVVAPGVSANYGSDAPDCPGVVESVPQAASGVLCIYQTETSFGGMPAADVTVKTFQHSGLTPPAGTTPVGALLDLNCSSAGSGFCIGRGVWAVTG